MSRYNGGYGIFNMLEQLSFLLQQYNKYNKIERAATDNVKTSFVYWCGVNKYLNEFARPFWIALNAFNTLEAKKLVQLPPWESVRDYAKLLQFSLQIAEKGLSGSIKAVQEYHLKKFDEACHAWFNTILDKAGEDGEDIASFSARQLKLLNYLVYTYPEAIKNIGQEYGIHLEGGGYKIEAETDRFYLYQVLPLDPKVKVRKNGKPIIIIPPYVLGPNILAFLPRERKSYIHAFADQGIPTYLRFTKEIDKTPAVQIMTGENDALDTQMFCSKLLSKHGKAVTLNGYCQGGFIAAVDLLSGKLDGMVDALIVCNSPMDGTRSVSLIEYLQHLPKRFKDLGYAIRTLSNGNQVVDGEVMSWVYKLKSMEKEAPLVTFYRDLAMFDRVNRTDLPANKTALAINHWLIYDRNDFPVEITKMSFNSYTIPVAADGTLPVKLFGKKLNFKRIKEKGIKFLICCSEKDDLVDMPSALAPLDYIDAEVTVFPKGHAAIATSWSKPDSRCALHTCFGENYRGPVRYQLDLESAHP
jgi:hypothetical protein